MEWRIAREDGKELYCSEEWEYFNISDLTEDEINEILEKEYKSMELEIEDDQCLYFTVNQYAERNICSDEECNCCGSSLEICDTYNFIYLNGNIYVNI